MPQHNRKLLILILVVVTASGPFAMQMFLPALPVIQAAFEVSPGTAQLAFSLSVLSMAMATLIYGPLSDRFGRRPVLILGMSVFLAGSLGAALAPSIEILIVARIVQSVGGAAGIVLSRSIIRDVYGHDGTARMMSYLIMSMVAAPMLAPIFGGVMTDLIGWRSIFAVISVVALAVVFLVIRHAPETHGAAARAANAGSFWAGMVRLMRSRAFLGYALTAATSISAFFAFLGAAPYLMVHTLGRSASEYGLYFAPVAAAFIVGAFISTRLVDRYGSDRLIYTGVFLTLGLVLVFAVALALLPLTPLLLFVPMVVISLVQGFVIPNCQAGAINVDPRYAGAASGLTGFLQMGLSAVSNQLVGSLNDGTVNVMIMAMVATGGLSAGIYFLARRSVNAETGAAPEERGTR